jgi:lipopolysaccharide transport system ATP-binding protein
LPTSSDLAVLAEGLTKQYRIGADASHTDSFRDLLTNGARRLLTRSASQSTRTFWALRNVSMEVAQGEVVAIIGRNGAGKSTLLKILSRITVPTSGRAELRGRLGSLLEVGTGFHPELTGRENIFLNGAILGMSRVDIARKLDEIIDFSGVSTFIDTPVKRYSSGMRVRLAFAVAAHLEPEILIVDEVLAVGDAEFQRKCLGKMSDVAHGGRTVLFVSHNLNAVLNLCTRGVVLERGEVIFTGAVGEAIRAYTEATTTPAYGFVDLTTCTGRPFGMRPIITGLGLRAAPRGDYTVQVNTGDDLYFDISYDCGDDSIDVAQLAISSTAGHRVLTLGTHLSTTSPKVLKGRGVLECRLPAVPLTAGEYDVTVMMTKRLPWHEVDYVEAALRFEVETNDYFGTGLEPLPSHGPVAQRSQWSLLPDSTAATTLRAVGKVAS